MLSREELNKLRDELLANDVRLMIYDKDSKCIGSITVNMLNDEDKSINIDLKINAKGNWDTAIIYSWDERDFTETQESVINKLEEYTNRADCRIEAMPGASSY